MTDLLQINSYNVPLYGHYLFIFLELLFYVIIQALEVYELN